MPYVATNTQKNQVEASPTFACLNKNFCNHPPELSPMALNLAAVVIATALRAFDEYRHGYALEQGRNEIAGCNLDARMDSGEIIDFATARRRLVERYKKGTRGFRNGPQPDYRTEARLAFRRARREGRNDLPVPEQVNIDLPPVRRLLRRVGYSDQTKNHKALLKALTTLQNKKLHFPHWYDDGANEDRWLPPLIANVAWLPNRRISIAVNGSWIAECRQYFAKVPLPLPKRTPAACFLYLWLMSWDTSAAKSPWRNPRTVCALLGLRTNQRAYDSQRDLRRVVRNVNRHLKRLDRCALAEQGIILPRRYRLDRHDEKGVRFVAVAEDRVRLTKTDIAYLDRKSA